jgi:hypothetical protein
LDADERALVLAARSSKDVPVKVRNKLYAALNRFVANGKLGPDVLAAWEAAEAKGPHGKFEFLQQWASDTSGGNVSLQETHSIISEDGEASSWVWVTKYDLYNLKKAWGNPEMTNYCNKLMTGVKTKKNIDPKFKNDKDMTMYRILKDNIESSSNKRKRASEMTMTADVEKDGHAAALKMFASTPLAKDKDPVDGPEKPLKVLKLTTGEMRMKKIQADLAAADLLLLEQTTSKLFDQIAADLKRVTAELRKVSHDMHEYALDNDTSKEERAWDAAKALLQDLKTDIDQGRALLYPGAYSEHTTQWDSVLLAK